MSELYRAFVVVLVLSATFFYFVRTPVCAVIDEKHFLRRRNLWLILTVTAFISHNVWIYTAVATLLILRTNHQETNPPALFFFILLVFPAGLFLVPGMGVINYLVQLSHIRLLELLILFPAFFSLTRQRDTTSFGRFLPDKVLIAYLVLIVLMNLRDSTVTDTFRRAFYAFIDVFLPYFVISRSLRDMEAFKDAILSLVIAIMALAPIASFEATRGWLLYHSLLDTLGLTGGMLGYLGRSGLLRGIATAGDSIPLGFAMALGIGLYLFLQKFMHKKLSKRMGAGLLVCGLLAALSRGPWVGAAAMLLAFISTGRNPIRKMMMLGLVVVLSLPLLAVIPGGEKFLNLLPFVGTTEESTVIYRQHLLDAAFIVVQRNPWLGSVNFLQTPEMEAMRGADGLIDLVNSYVEIVLEYGLIGLGLFVTFFTAILMGAYRAMRSIPDRDSAECLLGRSLVAILFATLVIIGTVSSISIIPTLYWSVAGLGVAYTQMIRKQSGKGRRSQNQESMVPS